MNVERTTIWRIRNKAQEKITKKLLGGKTMFNNFNLDDVEILKILDDYNPLITSMSRLRNGIDEDLMQEIKYMIYKTLTKNRKNYKKMQHRIKKGLLILEGGNNMDEKENTNQVAEVKNLKKTKNFSKTKDVISKIILKRK